MMLNRRDGAVLRQLRILYNVGTIGELTDGQLLERFATDPDEAAELAFSALVERHGPMVWRVCLAILRDQHHAEDAFQATFLVLVRKAGSLWVRDSLGPWLHQVACRTASCLRASLARRRKLDRGCASRNAGHSVEPGTECDPDLRAVGPRGSGPIAGEIPCADRALRPARPHPSRGGESTGMADRDRQEPPIAGPGLAPRSDGASRTGPRHRRVLSSSH